jgi:signal peptidase I
MYLLITLPILLFSLRYFLVIIIVQGRSMEPTLFSGDRVLLLRCRTQWLLRRGQIVVYQSPSNSLANSLPTARKRLWTGNSTINRQQTERLCAVPRQNYYIKRLLGLEGDQVVLQAQDMPYYAEYQEGNISHKQDTNGNFAWHVPQGCCFVKGDSRYSFDSTTLGPIPVNHIMGIVLFRLPRRTKLTNSIAIAPTAND